MKGYTFILFIIYSSLLIMYFYTIIKGHLPWDGKDNGKDNDNGNIIPSPKDKEFPKTECINYLNSTDEKITIWLDDMPPCLPVEQGGPPLGKCRQGPIDGKSSPDWSNSNARGFYHVKKDNTWVKIPPAQKQDLEPGEMWTIHLPKKDGKLYWCLDQAQKDGSFKRVCTGTGSWVTKAGSDMPAPGMVMRAEYNWNTFPGWDNVSYNLSGVEGINANMSMEYTGDGCKNSKTQCLIDFDVDPNNPEFGCKKEWETVENGVKSCSSPKRRCKDCSGLESCDMAGCGHSDEPTKCLCHKWWQTNKCGTDWCSYIQKNKSNKQCDLYCWAYDEKILKDPSNCSESDNPFSPLRNCKLTDEGNINIKILKVK